MEISIIITNFNYQKYLARAIRSAITQSFAQDEYEIIVIDDCSSDNSREIISSFGDRIISIFNDNNMGLANSCNKAIKQALGKYVIRLDSDDYLHRDCLKVHQLFLSNNKGDIDATSSDYYEVDDDENVIRRRNGYNFPIACGVMFKLDDMIDLGLYDPNLIREDVDFRHRFLASKRHIYNIPIPLYRYNKHLESLSDKA